MMETLNLYKQIKQLSMIISALLIFSVTAFSQSKVGTTSAQFLAIPVGAKSIAMGGAFTAVSDDPTGLYWNPGAISRQKNNTVYVSQTAWLVGSSHQWMGAQFMISPQDAIGFSLNNLSYGDREKVTTLESPDGTGEYWEASDMLVTLSYSRNITDRFSIGGSAKYIEQNIWHEKASQYAMDLGLLFITQFNGLQIGASLRNFGGELILNGQDLLERVDLDPENDGNNENIVANLKTDPWPLPLTFVVGVAMPIIDTRELTVTIAADAVRPTDNTETINTGMDVTLMNMLSFRAGYEALFRESSQSGLSFGLGLKTTVQGMKIIMDYSYKDFGFFGDIQTYSLGISF